MTNAVLGVNSSLVITTKKKRGKGKLFLPIRTECTAVTCRGFVFSCSVKTHFKCLSCKDVGVQTVVIEECWKPRFQSPVAASVFLPPPAATSPSICKCSLTCKCGSRDSRRGC